ncbi:MAG: hypothetical protein WD066_20330 [Planctomycetaceae bacterium]
MKTIDVEGLPEPVAQALHQVVRTLREQMHAPREARKPEGRPVQLREWPGKVIEPLTREEMYDDAGRI